MQLSGPWTRDYLAPLTDSCLSDAEFSAYGSLGPEMSDSIFYQHDARQYPIGDCRVNDGILAVARSYVPMDETKGERIKRLREARGLTQPALARLLTSMGAPSSLTKAAVAKWENGDTIDMKNETFILLAQALGTDPQYLLWGQDRTPPEPRSRPPSAERKPRRD